jgi:hypothetical protein
MCNRKQTHIKSEFSLMKYSVVSVKLTMLCPEQPIKNLLHFFIPFYLLLVYSSFLWIVFALRYAPNKGIATISIITIIITHIPARIVKIPHVLHHLISLFWYQLWYCFFEAKKETWKIYNNNDNGNASIKEKLAALKLIIESNEARFKLLSEGPSVVAMKSLEDRLNKIGSLQIRQQ